MDSNPHHNLLHFRKKHNLTQEETGALLGRSRQTINYWETRGRMDKTAVLLLDAMKWWPDDMVKRALVTEGKKEPESFIEWLRESFAGKKVIERQPGSDTYFSFQEIARRDFAVSALAEIARLDTLSAAPLIPEARTTEPLSPLALASRMARLGVQYTTFNPTEITRVAMFEQAPEAQWLLEGDSLTKVAIPMAVLNPPVCTVGTAVSLTRRLMVLTANNAEAVVMRQMLQSILGAIDQAAIMGDGYGGQPMGLINLPGLPTIEAGAGIVGALEAVGEAQETLENAGVDTVNLSILANPTTKRYLTTIQEDGSGTFWRVTEGGDVCAGLPAMSIPGLPDNTILMGDFGSSTIRHSEQASLRIRDNDPSGKSEVFMFVDCTVEFPRPSAFIKITNVPSL